MDGFQNMNFYLPKDIAKDNTMLTVNGGSSTDVKGVTFGVAALSGVNLQKGDTVNLLVNEKGLTTDDKLQTVESSKLASASFLAPNNLFGIRIAPEPGHPGDRCGIFQIHPVGISFEYMCLM